MSNLTRNVKLLTIISVILMIGAYLWLTINSFALHDENTKLTGSIIQKRYRINSLNDSISYLEGRQDSLSKLNKMNYNSIIAFLDSSNGETRKKGKELIKELGLTKFVVTPKEGTNVNEAKKYEAEGFNYLINRDVNSAIASFVKSENAYNNYKQSYEISIYLNKNRDSLKDKNSPLWREAYRKILTDYSWKIDDRVKKQLKNALN